jgi:hypothetical protein
VTAVTYTTGYVRSIGDGQFWHVADTAASATACGIEPPNRWGWPLWSLRAPAAVHTCPTCLGLDPRRTTAKRQAAR